MRFGTPKKELQGKCTKTPSDSRNTIDTVDAVGDCRNQLFVFSVYFGIAGDNNGI